MFSLPFEKKNVQAYNVKGQKQINLPQWKHFEIKQSFGIHRNIIHWNN